MDDSIERLLENLKKMTRICPRYMMVIVGQTLFPNFFMAWSLKEIWTSAVGKETVKMSPCMNFL